MITDTHRSILKNPARKSAIWFRCASLLLVLVAQAVFVELSWAAGVALTVIGIEIEGHDAGNNDIEVALIAPGQEKAENRLIRKGSKFDQGSEIIVPARTVLLLQSVNGNQIRLQPGSHFRINVVGSEGERYSLGLGKALFKVSNALNFFNVDYQKFLAIVHGTEFEMAVEPQKEISFNLMEGRLLVQREVNVKLLQENKEAKVIESEVLSPETKNTVSYRLDVDEYLKEFQNFKDAEEYFRLQLEGDEKSGDYQRVQEGLNAFGIMLDTVGKPGPALACYHRALQAADDHHDDGWVNCLLNNIGIAYYGLGEYQKAIGYFEKSLAMFLKLYSEGVHPDIAKTYICMGVAYGGLGEYQRAIGYYEKSLAMDFKLYPEGVHPDIAASYNNIGTAYYGLGEYQKAIGYHKKSLAMKLKLYPEGVHPDIAASYNNIGIAYRCLGKYQKAIGYYEKSLAMQLKLYPEGVHPDIAASYNNIGTAYYGLGEYQKAIGYFEKSLAMFLKLYPEGVHPYIATSYNNIGESYTGLGKYQKAIGYHKKSLAMRLKPYPKGVHPDIAESYNSFGDSYTGLGEYRKAIGYHQKALAVQNKLYPRGEHPDVAKSYTGLGKANNGLKEYLKAIVYHKKALAMRLKFYSDGMHPDIVKSYRYLAEACRKAKRQERAAEYEKKAQELEARLNR